MQGLLRQVMNHWTKFVILRGVTWWIRQWRNRLVQCYYRFLEWCFFICGCVLDFSHADKSTYCVCCSNFSILFSVIDSRASVIVDTEHNLGGLNTRLNGSLSKMRANFPFYLLWHYTLSTTVDLSSHSSVVT